MDLVKIQETHKKYFQLIQTLSGIAIVVLLVAIWNVQLNDKELKEEISLNCGWGEEDYYCFCEKSEAQELRNLFEQNGEDYEYYVNLTDGKVLEHPEGDYNNGWEASNVSLSG